jgi:hypothetical protein
MTLVSHVIYRVLTKGSSAEVQVSLRSPSSGSSARVQPMPLETFSVNKEMGRILIRRGGETIAAGLWNFNVLSCIEFLMKTKRRSRPVNQRMSRVRRKMHSKFHMCVIMFITYLDISSWAVSRLRIFLICFSCLQLSLHFHGAKLLAA